VPAEVLLSVLAYQSGVMNPGLLKGEQMDLELEHKPLNQVTAAEIQEMMELKTSLLLSFAARVGAALGSGRPIGESPVGEALAGGITSAGVAFQIQDDILGVFGEEAQLGKPIGSDLREGKRTLLIAETWRRASAEERRFLEENLGRQDMDEGTVAALRRLIEASGALESLQESARLRIAAADASLQLIENPLLRAHLAEYNARLTRRRK
jgi:geranylgeranyl diphosphate synthase type I